MFRRRVYATLLLSTISLVKVTTPIYISQDKHSSSLIWICTAFLQICFLSNQGDVDIKPRGRQTKGTLMKIMTLHPLVIVVEGFYASASEIRRTWDTSPCDGTGNGRLPDIP